MSPTKVQNPNFELSPSPSPSAMTTPALVLSNSCKRIDQGRKKYVKQVTGRHNDTELYLATHHGDLVDVKQILGDIMNQMAGTFRGEDLETEDAEVRASIVTEVNELGETAIFTVADKGHLDVVKELLKYSNKESLTKKNKSNLDPLHVDASQGHHDHLLSLLVFCDWTLEALHSYIFGMQLLYIAWRSDSKSSSKKDMEEVEEKFESGQGKITVRRSFSRFCTPIFLEAEKNELCDEK